MRRRIKTMFSLLAAVFIVCSLSIIVSANDRTMINSGSNQFFSWEFYSDNVLEITATRSCAYLQNGYIPSDVLTKTDKVLIDFNGEGLLPDHYYTVDGSSELAATEIVVDDARNYVNFFSLGNFNGNLEKLSFAQGKKTIRDLNIWSSEICSLDLFYNIDVSDEIYISDCNNIKLLNLPFNARYVCLDSCINVSSINLQAATTALDVYNSPLLTKYNIPSSLEHCSLINVGLSNVTVPKDCNFQIYSKALETATLNSGRTRTSYGMFQDCSNLKSVNIPNGVTVIEYNTFSGCEKLTNIELPDSVKTINRNAFRYTGIKSMNIPSGVTSLEYGTFFSCDSLNTVNIPESVTSIDESAFKYCNSLSDVYFDGSQSQWNKIAIRNGYNSSNKKINEIFGNATIHFSDIIVVQPENFYGQVGDTAKFYIDAAGDVAYQWQLKKGKTWANLSSGGAYTPTLSVKVDESRNGKIYRCVVTDSKGKTYESEEVKIIIVEPLIKITTQPVDYVGVEGSTAKFTVAAEGENLTYQWQLRKGSSWADLSSGGAKTSTMTVKVDAGKNGKAYRCLIKDPEGNYVASNTVTITVKEPSIFITSQPSNYVGTAGITARFSVTAEGEGLTYQWQLKKGKSWANLSSGGATTSTMSINVDESKNGKVYRCLITNADGEELASNEVSITIKEPAITIITQPKTAYAIAGDKVKFRVEAEGEGLTYQWQLKKGKSWADLTSGGATTNELTIKVDSGKFGKVYRCVITNSDGEQLATEDVSIIELTDHTEPPVNPEQQAPVHNEEGPIVAPVTPANSAEQQQPESSDVSAETSDTAESVESVSAPAETPAEAPTPAPVEPEAPVEQSAPAIDETA